MSNVFSEFDLDPLAQPASAIQTTIQQRQVANQQPSIQPTTFRLAIIGSHPSSDDLSIGKPFQGMAGRLLDQLLSKHGIPRSHCFVGNLTRFAKADDTPTPDDLLILQLDLEKADKICNDRFGIDTELSDKCFMAYLEFFKVSIELTTQGIEDYCKQTSADPIKVSECEQNMFNFFNNLGRLRG